MGGYQIKAKARARSRRYQIGVLVTAWDDKRKGYRLSKMLRCRAVLGQTLIFIKLAAAARLGKYEAAFRENEISEKVLPT